MASLEFYVLMKFEAVERYLDILLMGLLLLETLRLSDIKNSGQRVRELWVQARTTDRLRMLEMLCQEGNIRYIERAIGTPGGRRRLLKKLRRAPCQVP